MSEPTITLEMTRTQWASLFEYLNLAANPVTTWDEDTYTMAQRAIAFSRDASHNACRLLASNGNEYMREMADYVLGGNG